MGKRTLLEVNVAQLYKGVCELARVSLVKNCQMAIYGHPTRTGNVSDWTVAC